ncbi:MAG: Unknown protein [uncultured Sulfurovum sp.]|uniref:Uncharacterized protein n=1 Tax=uncultured Sulfurovum sp. TaxID=269237 RepID=A0A6S6TIS8_9BACT|nr:MAG: Unknown protein [uncultured Sulfurovum sp.]
MLSFFVERSITINLVGIMKIDFMSKNNLGQLVLILVRIIEKREDFINERNELTLYRR